MAEPTPTEYADIRLDDSKTELQILALNSTTDESDNHLFVASDKGTIWTINNDGTKKMIAGNIGSLLASKLVYDAMKDDGDFDKLSFIDTELIKSLDDIESSGVNFCTINSKYYFIYDGSDDVVHCVDLKSGKAVRELSLSVYGAIGADENVIVQAHSTSLRVIDIESEVESTYPTTSPGTNVRNVRKLNGNWYTVDSDDNLKSFSEADFLVNNEQTLASIDNQVCSFCVDGDSIYSVDASLTASGTLVVREHYLHNGALVQSSAAFSQKAFGGYAVQIDCYGDYLILVYGPSAGTNEAVVILKKSNLQLVYESTSYHDISVNALINGLIYSSSYTSPNIESSILSLPSLTRSLPERTKFKHFEYITESGETRAGEDFSRAVTKADTAMQIPMGVSVESVETTPVAASTITTNSWPISDQDGLTFEIELTGYPAQSFVFAVDTLNYGYIASQINANIDGVIVSARTGSPNYVSIISEDAGSNISMTIGGTNTITWANPTDGTGAPSDVVDAWYLIEDTGKQLNGYVTQYTTRGFEWYAPYEGAKLYISDTYENALFQADEWRKEFYWQFSGVTEATTSETVEEEFLSPAWLETGDLASYTVEVSAVLRSGTGQALKEVLYPFVAYDGESQGTAETKNDTLQGAGNITSASFTVLANGDAGPPTTFDGKTLVTLRIITTGAAIVDWEVIVRGAKHTGQGDWC